MPSGNIWDYQHKIGRIDRRRSNHGWTRRVVFEGLQGYANVAAIQAIIPPDSAVFPGEGGQLAAILVNSTIQPNMPEGAQVVLYYRPPTAIEWLEAFPNHGVLMCSAAIRSRRVKVWHSQSQNIPDSGFDTSWGSLYGNWQWKFGIQNPNDTPDQWVVLDGQDPRDPSGQTSWKILSGSNTQVTHYATYQVFSIVDNLDDYFYQFLGKMGHYNHAPMGTFPLAPRASKTGQWMLTSMSMSPRATSRYLWTVRHSFQLNLDTEGWAGWTTSGKFKLETRTIPVRDADGVDTGGKRVVTVLAPTNETVSVQMIEPANFQQIELLLLNSWHP